MMSGPLLMRIEREVVEARVVSRPNRFTLVVDVGGRQVPCHLHDPGRLKELTKPGLRALVTKPVYRSIRKTLCDVLSIEVGGTWVLVDSRLPNRLFREAVSQGLVFQGYEIVAEEVWLGRSRIDFLLGRGSEELYVEVKGCNLAIGNVALFPDAPTRRGARHVNELLLAMDAGFGAAVVFVILRPDAAVLRPNSVVDPVFADTLCRAHREGLAITAFKAVFNPSEKAVFYGGEVPVEPCVR